MTISEIVDLQTERLLERCPNIPRDQLHQIAETGLVMLFENGEAFGVSKQRMAEFLEGELLTPKQKLRAASMHLIKIFERASNNLTDKFAKKALYKLFNINMAFTTDRIWKETEDRITNYVFDLEAEIIKAEKELFETIGGLK
ncbi:MAG: hypothetical protein LBC87_07400 [Fibromonadaceae bacterium]|jgi:hypothetical protein|nr:hypothetical protein [Fibromonadaceae bacterium]